MKYLLTLSLLVASLINCIACPAAEFIPLGSLPGPIFTGSTPFFGPFIADDGSLVVGNITVSGHRTAFRWTRESGTQSLDVLLSKKPASARGLSGDGSTIVGERADGNNGSEPFTLDLNSEQLVKLKVPPNISPGSATGVSDDGSVVIGWGSATASGDANRAIYWRGGETGAVLGDAQFSTDLQADAVSGNGAVIVGRIENEEFGFRWTEDLGMQPLPRLPDLPDEPYSPWPLGISTDGRWTVGLMSFQDFWNRQAVRWDGTSEPVALTPATDGWGTSAIDVTDDGGLVTGVIYPNHIFGDRFAGIWTEATGFTALDQWLISEHGLGDDLTGWKLGLVTDMTADGRFLVGYGDNPAGVQEAFLIDLAPTTSTPRLGDVNQDGEVNGLDVGPFTEVLLNGSDDNATRILADMNSDGEVNGLDVDSFVAAVVGGAQSIPEPSTLLLCTLALCVIGAWRRWGV